jgi:two-component system, NarL family, nitrate/nitrite response regulator NarL
VSLEAHQITAIIASDHPLFWKDLDMFLAQQDDVQVVGKAADGFQLLHMVEALQPDILLLDVQLPNSGGIEVLRKVHAMSPRTKGLVLSDLCHEELITKASQYNTKGCMLKTCLHEDYLKAIHVIHAGDVWFGRKVLVQALQSLLQKLDKQRQAFSESLKNLTDREQEIIKWLIQGMTNKEIAGKLGITDKTVKKHFSNIFNKLGVHRRSQILSIRLGATRPNPKALP